VDGPVLDEDFLRRTRRTTRLMRILFAVSHLGFLRNFESTLALLAERGHRIHLVTDRKPQGGVIDGMPIVERLVARFPGAVSLDTIPVSKRDPWYAVATAIREAINYWRYLAPAFDRAPKLRARGRAQAPPILVALSDLPLLRSRAGVRALVWTFRRLERALPVRQEVEALFDRWKPDVLLVTPLLYFGSHQVDYVRCARRRGVGSVLGVGSWDHLTTKGLIHELPDRILVWNELQRTEAVDFHGARRDQVIVTGAQPYDHWFAMRPSTTREEFCARAGLPADRPYLLYLCSSPFIAPYEVDVVRRWITAIRATRHETLRSVGILVRPHPQNAAQWADVDLSPFGAVSIWPRAGANPIGADTRRQYYDSMYHAHAVVGVNTSALIESGIVGRLVYSFHVPEFAETQEGTLHFQHLKRGGLLTLAATIDEHVDQLQRSFASTAVDRQRVRDFIQLFVRPYGLDEPATPLVVRAIEEQSMQRPAPQALPVQARAVQFALRAALAVGARARGAARAVRGRAGEGLERA
jgi:hypothetical protein